MKAFLLHDMPYADAAHPLEEGAATAWVTYANRHYDPVTGQRLFDEYLQVFRTAEDLGFDGVAIPEYHQTPYSLTPSPIAVAGAAAVMTQKISLAVLGRALPLQKNPVHVAEEFAVLDHLSHGRIIAGVQRGLAPEYHNSGMSPHKSHERFFEATDLIVRSWTQPGPFYHSGEHYQLYYVNPWPKPVQQPRPPLWILSQGSEETLRWAAANERQYPVILGLMSAGAAERAATVYLQSLDPSVRDRGGDEKLGVTVLVHVAETDARARDQARVHAEYFFNRLFLRPIRQIVPFNYAPLATLQRLQSEYQLWSESAKTLEAMESLGMLIVGSPATVKSRLAAHLDRVRAWILVVKHQFGLMPASLILESMTLFAQTVLSDLRRSC